MSLQRSFKLVLLLVLAASLVARAVCAAPDGKGGDRCAESNGAPELIAENQQPDEVAVDDEFVYWTNQGTGAHQGKDGSIRRAPKAGGPVVELASQQEKPGGIGVAAGQLFWLNHSTARHDRGALMSMPKAGGVARMLAPGGSELPLQIAHDKVFWSDGACIFALPLAGGARSKSFDCTEREGNGVSRKVTAFQVSGDYLYYLTKTAPRRRS
jgi:hypothetical protein